MNHLQFRLRRGGWTRPEHWEELRLQDISWWGNSKQAYDGGLGESGGKSIMGQEPRAGVRHGSVGAAGPADDIRQLVRGHQRRMVPIYWVPLASRCLSIAPS